MEERLWWRIVARLVLPPRCVRYAPPVPLLPAYVDWLLRTLYVPAIADGFYAESPFVKRLLHGSWD